MLYVIEFLINTKTEEIYEYFEDSNYDIFKQIKDNFSNNKKIVEICNSILNNFEPEDNSNNEIANGAQSGVDLLFGEDTTKNNITNINNNEQTDKSKFKFIKKSNTNTPSAQLIDIGGTDSNSNTNGTAAGLVDIFSNVSLTNPSQNNQQNQLITNNNITNTNMESLFPINNPNTNVNANNIVNNSNKSGKGFGFIKSKEKSDNKINTLNNNNNTPSINPMDSVFNLSQNTQSGTTNIPILDFTAPKSKIFYLIYIS